MTEPEPPACPSCNGKGGDMSGPCWDCQGGGQLNHDPEGEQP